MAGWLARALGRHRNLRLPPDAAEAAAEQLLVMDEALEAIVELPGLEDLVETRALPHGLLRLWRRALAAYDEYLELTVRFGDGGEGLAVRCTLGCNGCCHGAPTGLQAVEHLAIYQAARSFPDFEAIHAAARESADALLEDARRVAPGVDSLPRDDRSLQRALLTYRTRARPCVFQEAETGNCRIYDLRPIACRMHFSVTDPALCWPGHPDAKRARTPELPPPEAIVDTMKEIARRMRLDQLSPVLFQGLVHLGGELLGSEPLTEGPPRERARRRSKPQDPA